VSYQQKGVAMLIVSEIDTGEYRHAVLAEARGEVNVAIPIYEKLALEWKQNPSPYLAAQMWTAGASAYQYLNEQESAEIAFARAKKLLKRRNPTLTRAIL